MAIEIRPATVFEDVQTMVGPKRPDANVCWCLSYRIPSKENRELVGPARAERVKALLRERPLDGAVDFAREQGAPAIEGYPVDNRGAKVDLTMAYVGTRRLFEQAGFEKVSDTDSVLDGFPRVLMRRDL